MSGDALFYGLKLLQSLLTSHRKLIDTDRPLASGYIGHIAQMVTGLFVQPTITALIGRIGLKALRINSLDILLTQSQ